MFIKKILNNIIIRIIFFIIIIYYLFNNLNKNEIINNFNSIDLNFIFLVIIIQIFNPLLFSLKWYILVKKYYTKNFIHLNNKLSFGLIIQEIFQSTSVMDVYKFIYLEKIKTTEKIKLIINEKFITIFFRFFFLFIFFTLFNLLIFKLNSHINILLFFLALLIIFILNFLAKKISFIKEYQIKYFSNISFDRKKIIFIELMRNTIIFFTYFLILLNFFDFENSLMLSFIGPIVEIIVKIFQHLPTFGYRELIFFTIGQFTLLDENILLVVSVVISSILLLTNILYYYTNIFIYRKLNYFKNV